MITLEKSINQRSYTHISTHYSRKKGFAGVVCLTYVFFLFQKKYNDNNNEI